jgi:hypothetical protein
MNKATPTEDEEKLAKKIATALMGHKWWEHRKDTLQKRLEVVVLDEIIQHNRQTTEEVYVDPKQLPLGLVENDWE